MEKFGETMSWNLYRLELILILLFCSGCMTYQNFPSDRLTPISPPPARRAATLGYNIEGGSLFAGPAAIRNVIATEAPFTASAPAENEHKLSYFLSVKITQLPPSVPAVVFGYLSYATLTILPFWSTHDGTALTFILYKDGLQQKAKEYLINRATFIWLPMLPVAWINFMTPSEEDAFAASAREFLADI